MRYQIIKPMCCDWNTFGSVLRSLQRETRETLNKTIQLCWEYQGFSADYKAIHNEYPKTKDILNYSSMHGFAYDNLKHKVQVINKGNFAQTIKRGTDKWKSDLKEILRGNKSIPTFKKDCPIDIVKSSIKVRKEGNQYIITFSLIGNEYKKQLDRKNGSFELLVKVADNSQKTIINRVIDGSYKLSASQIVFKKNKWYFILSYQFEKIETRLPKDNIMGVDLGIVNPVYMAFNSSLERYHMKGGEIERFRNQVEKRKKELLNQGKYSGEGRKGHGRKTRTKPVNNINNKIARFRDTCNHKYSRYVVDMAKKHRCGVIQMEDLSFVDSESIFLRNWSYYDLQEKIENKAVEEGIEVVYINPDYTSQRCSKCGKIDKQNRPNQSTFECQSCNFKTNADFNAARNISTKNIDVIIANELKSSS
ncbi:RNA-guided endonuclease TnpB family protein [Bacillus sp. SCS-151]|uniref:RNA-guided endonuclease TnpB family protein n=1 Tax=Nanhaiella sioensis TaxID=3115293 RepID=UPI003979D3B4